MIIETAHAKINFTLSVGSKRADGYHSIDSLMHSISLSDRITLTKAEAITLSVTEGEAPLGRENLMVRAAERFFEETGLPGGVSMTLAKRIPSEAGMGGGSSDAAAVLRGLARLYETDLSLVTLARWGASLGADIPFCVAAGAARCQGIGEKLTPLTPWAHLPLVILRPPVSVSTGKAYQLLDHMGKRPMDTTPLAIEALSGRDPGALARALSNDFEAGLFPVEPILWETSAYLKTLGRPALMTGSGSAFFVLAKDTKEQAVLASRIRTEQPSWFVEMAETVGRDGEA